jgi:hypothetical protein
MQLHARARSPVRLPSPSRCGSYATWGVSVHQTLISISLSTRSGSPKRVQRLLPRPREAARRNSGRPPGFAPGPAARPRADGLVRDALPPRQFLCEGDRRPEPFRRPQSLDARLLPRLHAPEVAHVPALEASIPARRCTSRSRFFPARHACSCSCSARRQTPRRPARSSRVTARPRRPSRRSAPSVRRGTGRSTRSR